mmetsp:Transcript_29700/g.70773  ORF Transcript_29700/g.70773 Transcript_29700/m.70773 type:complete len:214 (+) Transcript_29700:1590-2231(+)
MEDLAGRRQPLDVVAAHCPQKGRLPCAVAADEAVAAPMCEDEVRVLDQLGAPVGDAEAHQVDVPRPERARVAHDPRLLALRGLRGPPVSLPCRLLRALLLGLALLLLGRVPAAEGRPAGVRAPARLDQALRADALVRVQTVAHVGHLHGAAVKLPEAVASGLLLALEDMRQLSAGPPRLALVCHEAALHKHRSDRFEGIFAVCTKLKVLIFEN